MLETNKPKKIWLQIKENGRLVEANILVQLEKENLLQLVNRQFSNIESIDRLSEPGQVHIYAVKFNNHTQCSHADSRDFAGASVTVDQIKEYAEEHIEKYIKNLDEHNVGWNFFSLGDKSIKASSTMISFQHDTLENERVDALKTALSKGNFFNSQVNCKVTDLSDKRHYCQFGGGGDIFFQLSGQSTIVCSDTTYHSISLSPEDNSSLTSNLVEGKACGAKIDGLTHQLMANLVIAGTKTLIDSVKTKKIVEKSAVKELNKISSYGIAITGASVFGFMKLEIDFAIERMTFKWKVPMQTSTPKNVAAAVDFCLAYIMKKHTQCQPAQMPTM